MVLCCLCGKSIEPNAVSMCHDCIRVQADITEGIETNCDLFQCPVCQKFNITREKWIRHEWESNGLMALCLKKVRGLDKAKLIDAKWVWTEPHSKRLKISVEVEKTVLEKVLVRQRVTIVFVLKSKQCLECVHDQTAHNWSACIQIRQKGMKSRKTLEFLENLLASKPQIMSRLKKFDAKADGLDLFCMDKPIADKITGFIGAHFPIKLKSSKKLISTSSTGGHNRYEFTIQADIAALGKGDLVILPPELAGRAELMLVRNISQIIHCISPTSTNMVDLSAGKYFHKPITPLLSIDELIPFVVMDVTPVDTEGRNGSNAQQPTAHLPTVKVKHRYKSKSKPVFEDDGGGNGGRKLYAVLAEAWVCKESELGVQDATTYHCYTHLGHILRAGDVVMGYDIVHSAVFANAGYRSKEGNNGETVGRSKSSATKWAKTKQSMVTNDLLLERIQDSIPDVVLVHKQKQKPSRSSSSSGNSEARKRRAKKIQNPRWNDQNEDLQEPIVEQTDDEIVEDVFEESLCEVEIDDDIGVVTSAWAELAVEDSAACTVDPDCQSSSDPSSAHSQCEET